MIGSPDTPVVSVGVPTYDRPQGLRRTLHGITSQTYERLEIIVSDNCSPTAETAEIVHEQLAKDRRITYVRQERNIGAYPNFQFVLHKATGQYFMWAADDDEWDPRFIETCARHIGPAGSAMTGWRILHRRSGRSTKMTPASLSVEQPAFVNASTYLGELQSSLFYGLHRRDSILAMERDKPFDFYDCYFVLRQILTNGFVTVPDELYTAGVDGEAYIIKPFRPRWWRLLEYVPFFTKAHAAIMASRAISDEERERLRSQLVALMPAQFKHERQVNSPVVYWARLRCFRLMLRLRASMLRRHCGAGVVLNGRG